MKNSFFALLTEDTAVFLSLQYFASDRLAVHLAMLRLRMTFLTASFSHGGRGLQQETVLLETCLLMLSKKTFLKRLQVVLTSPWASKFSGGRELFSAMFKASKSVFW